jgi:hypothetical protein
VAAYHVLVAQGFPPSENEPDPTDKDVITFGKAPMANSPHGRTFKFVVGAAVIVLVLAALLATRHQGHMPITDQPRTQHSGIPSSQGAPTPAGPGGGELHGSPVVAPTHVQLVVALHGGSTPVWFNIDTGARTPIALPPSAEGYSVDSLPNGALLQAGATQPCAGCPGDPFPVYYSRAGSAFAMNIGSANGDIAESADALAAWLSTYRHPAQSWDSPDQTIAVREVDWQGRVTQPAFNLPTGYALDPWLQQPLDGAMLLKR